MNDVPPPRLLAENLSYAGLGNRLRFTLSARNVATDIGARFEYYWPLGKDFGAKLTDLWHFDAEEVDHVPAAPPLQAIPDAPWPPREPLIHVKSASVMRGSGRERAWEESLQELRPASEVSQRVAEFRRSSLPERYVGVQMRLSAQTHAKTLEASPLQWYIDRMSEMRASNPEVFFFISSDDEDASAVLVKEFNASALEKSAAYNSAPALIQSVVDLILLSEADYLLGPHWSSFVHTAWLLGGRRQTLETSRSIHQASPAASAQ